MRSCSVMVVPVSRYISMARTIRRLSPEWSFAARSGSNCARRASIVSAEAVIFRAQLIAQSVVGCVIGKIEPGDKRVYIQPRAADDYRQPAAGDDIIAAARGFLDIARDRPALGRVGDIEHMVYGSGAPSPAVALAVPISMRRYICMESAETISPPSACASSIPRRVFRRPWGLQQRRFCYP